MVVRSWRGAEEFSNPPLLLNMQLDKVTSMTFLVYLLCSTQSYETINLFSIPSFQTQYVIYINITYNLYTGVKYKAVDATVIQSVLFINKTSPGAKEKNVFYS